MAAMTAVVAAQKEAERGAAGGRITAGGSRVGLWLSAWELLKSCVKNDCDGGRGAIS